VAGSEEVSPSELVSLFRQTAAEGWSISVSNFKKLWEEGIGRLMVVYVVALFGFIIWVGLFISWLFFHGVKPPLAG